MQAVFLESPIPPFSATKAQVQNFENSLPQTADKPIIHCQNEEEFLRALPKCTKVYVWTFKQEWFTLAPCLTDVYTPAAGRDYFHVTPPPQVTMHYGTFHGAIMGETALGALLACAHGLLPYATKKGWPRLEMAQTSRRICGSIVLILGYGKIGQAFANMLAPLGAKIIGITKHPHPEFPPRENFTYATINELDTLLPSADHIVCFLPSGPDTTHLLNAHRLSLLKPTSFLYNFGRGNLIDESALAQALSKSTLQGAVLDVFSTEPLPPTSPLLTLPNCYTYPHASAFSPDYLDLYFASL